jgi:hypothetical protein
MNINTILVLLSLSLFTAHAKDVRSAAKDSPPLSTALSSATKDSLPRSSARGVTSADDCKPGVCGGMANYPVAPGIRFYSTFNVPGLPLNKSAIENDITFFIYSNIFFDGGKGQCPQCKMNQFVNQLMLGQPLYGSTGPPNYDPLWMPATTWIFAAQYFMEIYDNSTAKAAAGPWFNCTEGDILWTEYSLDDNWFWKLSMGVVGDPTRTSSIIVEQPFMGLLVNNGTTSWKEEAYSVAHYNTCLELYGISPYGGTHYPSSSMVYEIRTTLGDAQDPFPWQTRWSDVEQATCPRGPNSTFYELHNTTSQSVIQNVYYQVT